MHLGSSVQCAVCVRLVTMNYALLVVLMGCAGLVRAGEESLEGSSMGMLSRALERCSGEQDLFSCLKMKAVNLLDRALAMDSLPISDFMVITKDPTVKESTAPAPAPALQDLPRDLGEKNSALDRMINDRLTRYLDTRTVQVNLPKDVFEGRRKYKKSGGIFLVFGAFAAMLLQLVLGKIAVIAGKALLVGKVALLLAGIVGLKSLLSHQGESHSSQVIYAEPEHHGGWGRSLGAGSDAQDIVYRRHRPSTSHRY